MSDMVSVPAEKIAALREALDDYRAVDPASTSFVLAIATDKVETYARAVVDAVETEDEGRPAGKSQGVASAGEPPDVTSALTAPSPARDDAEEALPEIWAMRRISDGRILMDQFRRTRPADDAVEGFDWVLYRPAHMAAPDELTALPEMVRLETAEKYREQRDALRQKVAELEEKCNDMKFDRNNAEKVEGLAIGLESDLRSARAKVELLAQRLDEKTLSRDKMRAERDALRERIRKLADEWEKAGEPRELPVDFKLRNVAARLRAALGDA